MYIIVVDKKKDLKVLFEYIEKGDLESKKFDIVRCKYFIKWRNNVSAINISDIYYIECCQRNINIYTRNKMYKKIGKISEEESLLKPYGFFRVHQGYLVNMFYIKDIKDNEVVLLNGVKVPISVRKRKETLREFNDYIDNLQVINSSL